MCSRPVDEALPVLAKQKQLVNENGTFKFMTKNKEFAFKNICGTAFTNERELVKLRTICFEALGFKVFDSLQSNILLLSYVFIARIHCKIVNHTAVFNLFTQSPLFGKCRSTLPLQSLHVRRATVFPLKSGGDLPKRYSRP